VYRLGPGRHIAFRVEIGVIRRASRNEIDHLDASNLDHPVPGLGVEPGGFGIEYDLAH